MDKSRKITEWVLAKPSDGVTVPENVKPYNTDGMIILKKGSDGAHKKDYFARKLLDPLYLQPPEVLEKTLVGNLTSCIAPPPSIQPAMG